MPHWAVRLRLLIQSVVLSKNKHLRMREKLQIGALTLPKAKIRMGTVLYLSRHDSARVVSE